MHYLLPVCPLSSLSSNSSAHLDQVVPKRASVKGETSVMVAASSNVKISHVNHIVVGWCVESQARVSTLISAAPPSSSSPREKEKSHFSLIFEFSIKLQC